MAADPGPAVGDRWPLTRRQLAALAGLPVLTACSGGGPRGPASPSPAPADRVSRPVEDFGAVGDGRTDDSAALARALDELEPGQALVLARGRTYLHADVLVCAVPDVLVTGGGVLLATEEERSSLQVEASGVTVEDLVLAVRTTSRRWDAPAQHRLYVGAHERVALRRVRVTGSAAAGIFLAGTSAFTIDAAVVADTRADGIHLTQGTHDGTVREPRTSRTGDDGVAVVSYLEDGAVCHDVTVTRPVVATTTGGRGVSVVGGEDIAYDDVSVTGSAAAAVYLACEGEPFNSAPTRRVTVRGGTVEGANTDAGIDHGAVLVYSGRGDGEVSDVEVSGLRIRGTRSSASRQVGVISDAGPATGIRLEDLDVEARPTPFTQTSGGCCDTGPWTVGGRRAQAVA